jgi:streptogramin lyase
MLMIGLWALCTSALGCAAEASPHAGNSGVQASAALASDDPAVVQLPGGQAGIGLDDLRYSKTLGRVVSPAGRTGNLDLVDPRSLEVTPVGGFTAFSTFDGDDQQGVESADEGSGLVFAVDRASYTLSVVEPSRGSIVATTQLDATEPDYIRYVAATSEVWITHPARSTIEVLSVPKEGSRAPVHVATIAVSGGVEGLTIDNTRRRAYTHNFAGTVAAIDLDDRAVVATWPTGCAVSHGIPAIDEARGLLFAGCGSAETVVLDLDHDGTRLGGYALGMGRTILAYAPNLRHLYMRGDPGTTVAVLEVSDAGGLTPLGTFETTEKGHCMTADDAGNVWVCDWKSGRLLRFEDPFASSGAP